MSRYTVTDIDGCYGRTYADRSSGWGSRWAMDVDDAANMWAEDVYSDLDFPDEMECIVTNPDGERFKVTVYAEQTVTFRTSATEHLAPSSPDGQPAPGPSDPPPVSPAGGGGS